MNKLLETLYHSLTLRWSRLNFNRKSSPAITS